MKITNEHYEELAKHVRPLHDVETWKEYQRVGMSATRYRFDLLYRAKISDFVCNTLYRYLNDDHIATALKKAVPLR